jgi:phage-related protein
MKHDLELTQKAVVVALNKIEQLEKENDNRRKNTEDSGVQDLDGEKEG